MSKWVLDQADEQLDYPTLGFTAGPNDILDSTAAPDGRWSLNGDQGAAETVTRYTIGGDPSYVEPGDGYVLTWSDEDNAFVPTARPVFLEADMDDPMAALIEDSGSATASALSTSTDARIGSTPGYDIVILAGQSNMSGRGTPYSSTLDPVNARVEQWKTHGTLGIQPAVEPLDMHDTPSGLGPGLQFGRWYAARRISGIRKVLLVPCAHGGTPLASNATPLGWRRGVSGNLYENMITQALAAKAAADAIDDTTNRIVAVLWLQGETDGDNSIGATQYATDLDAIITGSRTDLGVADLPWVIGTMVPEYLTTGTRAAINYVHRDTPNRIARTDVAVSAVGMNKGDGNHFSGLGSRFNGKAMFEAYERIAEGIGPYSEGLPADLGPVVGLTTTSVGGISAGLSWTALVGATSYIVEAKGPADTTWQEIGAPTGTSGTFGPLLPSTVYQIRVTPVGGSGAGYPCSPITITTGAGTATVADAFTRTNAGSLGTADSGQTYSTLVGTCATDGAAAYHGSGANNIGVLDATLADAFAEIDLTTLAASGIDRLIFRNDNSVNNYWLVQYRQSSNKFQVYKCVAGTFTQVGLDLGLAPANGDRIGIGAVGGYLMVTVNRVVQTRIKDTFAQTNTRHGLGGGSSNTGRLDNFSVRT